VEIARDADLSERTSVRIGQHASCVGAGVASHDGGDRVATNGLMEDTPVPGF